jgi:hypothetical protein
VNDMTASCNASGIEALTEKGYMAVAADPQIQNNPE